MVSCTDVAQHLDHLFLVKKLKDSRTQVVEVRCKGSKVDRSRISFQRV